MKRPLDSVIDYRNSLRFAAAALIAFMLIFAVYVRAEKAVDHANKMRLDSLQLSEELRHSSDQLTESVRAYVQTGELRHKQRYREILDLRDGRSTAAAATPNAPLLERMRLAGFTADEITLLEQAKANSDRLTEIEFAAMRRVESSLVPPPTERWLAAQSLHDEDYRRAKAGILEPIARCQQSVERRTRQAVEDSATLATQLRVAVVLCGILVLFMLWRAGTALRRTLGGPLAQINALITQLGNGDFVSPVTLHPRTEDSVAGRLVHMQNALTGLDERRRAAETVVAESNQKYHALSEATFDAIFLSEKGRCLEQNAAAEQMFGYSTAEAVGRLGTDWIAQEDRERVMQNMISGFREPYEAQALRKDGSTFPVLIRGRMMQVGERSVRVTWLSDISARRAAEQAQRASEALLQEITDNTTAVIYAKDFDGRILRVNRQFETLFQLTGDSVLGKTNEEIFPPDIARKFAENDRYVIESGLPFHGEEIAPHTDGPHTYYSVKFPLRDKVGRIYGICGISTDITERKRAEETLLASEARLRESEQRFACLFEFAPIPMS